jgi:hypothetical protein
MDGTKAKKNLLAVLHVGHLTRQLPSDKAVKCGSACAAQDDGKVNGKIVMEV